jgi:hypothetical protein
MKRSLLISAAAIAFAAMPLLAAKAMPRAAEHAAVTGTDNRLALAHGDHGLAWRHMVRIARDRDDAWSRGLRRFRDSFD